MNIDWKVLGMVTLQSLIVIGVLSIFCVFVIAGFEYFGPWMFLSFSVIVLAMFIKLGYDDEMRKKRRHR